MKTNEQIAIEVAEDDRLYDENKSEAECCYIAALEALKRKETMTTPTDDLLRRLPHGSYALSEPSDQLGFLTLLYEGGGSPWCACYHNSDSDEHVRAAKPPHSALAAWGDTPNEALQGLYDLLKKHKLLPRED